MRAHTIAAVTALALLSFTARAEVKETGGDHMLIQDSRTVHAAPEKLYVAIVDIGHWWSSEHTYSGDATHLNIQAEAGGCFCERWGNQSVAHGHVIWAAPGHLLRLDTALGPLQSMAVQGVMTFSLKPAADGTTLQFDYRVNGSSASALDKVAPNVNDVLMQQLQRLQHYVETGKSQPPQS